MKKYISIIIAVVLVVCCIIFGFQNNEQTQEQIFRLHIRANSNEQIDQEVKMQIKEEFVEFLTPYVADCNSKQDVMDLTIKLKAQLEEIADNILISQGFSYKSNVKVCNEYFPERYYGDFQVQKGYYDALICELGEAKGDNWWCVVYPPLCFVDYNATNNVVYKSKLWEIINKFFCKES